MSISLNRLRNWFGGRQATSDHAVLAETRVYAIGDVHGCLSELDALLDMIAGDLVGWRGNAEIVFLGDYVDRGPDSAGVIERLTRSLPGDRHIFLSGNHEEAMLRCLRGEGDVAEWLKYGGVQTLTSYGLSRTDLFSAGFSLTSWAKKEFPRRHLAFLECLGNSHRNGDYFFAHAGVRPGVPLDAQHTADLRWIRSEFLGDERNHGAMVVHGHTISPEVSERSNRIGVDTGCYSSGTLTALVLEGTTRRYLQTRREDKF